MESSPFPLILFIIFVIVEKNVLKKTDSLKWSLHWLEANGG